MPEQCVQMHSAFVERQALNRSRTRITCTRIHTFIRASNHTDVPCMHAYVHAHVTFTCTRVLRALSLQRIDSQSATT